MSSSDDGVYSSNPRMPMARAMRPRRLLRGALAPREGQSLTEFALVLPFFMLLVIGIAAFGMAFERKIAVDNAARSAARYAIVHPDMWSNAASPGYPSIQWWAMQEGASAGVSNSDPSSFNTNCTASSGNKSSISIQYCTADSSGNLTECGHYSVSSGFVEDSGSGTNGASDCLKSDNIIRTTVTVPFKLQVPWLPNFFPNGIVIQSSATMQEEQNCSSC